MKNNLNSYKLTLGCVADDFTGASDMASFLELGGLKTLLINGIPDHKYIIPKDINAIVIALKSRSSLIEKAVEDSMIAFKWLKNNGAKQLFFKYGSTFDSNKKGNIGPVIDSVLEYFKIKYTVISPALPINGRTVKDGHLYIFGTPLHESSMKHHPLNPMWDSDIEKLLSSQGKYTSYNINYITLEKDKEFIDNQIRKIINQVEDNPFYLIADHFNDAHAKKIVEIFGEHTFLTGSSGLAYELALYHSSKIPSKEKQIINTNNLEKKEKSKGKLIIAGSCSETTCRQIRYFIQEEGLSIRVDPIKLMEGALSKNDFYDLINNNPKRDILFYSAQLEDKALNGNTIGSIEIAKLIENTMADIAKFGIKEGLDRIIIAGGETSGAVAKALDLSSYYIGGQVSPGVPELIPEVNNKIRLVFKSGNFGEDDFFVKALSE